jgi:hypothetical protein
MQSHPRGDNTQSLARSNGILFFEPPCHFTRGVRDSARELTSGLSTPQPEYFG